jgi:hypothetical protein
LVVDEQEFIMSDYRNDQPEKPKRGDTSYGTFTSAYMDEKPKRDFRSSYGGYNNPTQERGGCLTAFLLLNMVVSALGLIAICGAFTQMNRISSSLRGVDTGTLSFILLISLVLGVASFIGLWNWQKWGYQGMFAFYVISIILNLCSFDAGRLIGNVIGLAILYYLVSPIEHLLE